ncbi:MAG: hypothetical protein Q4C47_02215, partial [Planctomycetia bacterium]|nr:hypothetical protein [Planctomycetia bacterium]
MTLPSPDRESEQASPGFRPSLKKSPGPSSPGRESEQASPETSESTFSTVPGNGAPEIVPDTSACVSFPPLPPREELWWIQAKDHFGTGMIEVGQGVLLALRGLGKLVLSAVLAIGVGTLRIVERFRGMSVVDDDAAMVDLRALESRLSPLAPDAPRVALYGVPLRLVAVVVAPAGNQSPFRGYQELSRAMELAVPGLSQVLKTHAPEIILWAA